MVINKNTDIYTYLSNLLNIKEITELLETNKSYYIKIKNEDNITKNALVYSIVREKTAYTEDSEEEMTKYLVQLDLYSNINFTQLLMRIKKHFKENELIKQEIMDGFEEKYKYHKILRYTVILDN